MNYGGRIKSLTGVVRYKGLTRIGITGIGQGRSMSGYQDRDF